jgi:hypothetical protein
LLQSLLTQPDLTGPNLLGLAALAALAASQGLLAVTTTVLFANFTAVNNVDALTNVVIVVFLSDLDERVRHRSRGKEEKKC